MSVHGQTHQRNNDLVLLQRLALGQGDCFWELWERHRPRLERCCRRWLNGQAEDAVSKTMMKAWDRLPDCAAEIQDLSAWLTQLAHNVCMDWLRENSRSSRYMEQLVTLHGDTELSADDPGRILVEREGHEHLLRLVDALPLSLRRPFILHTLHEMSYRDISEELNLSEANLRKRVQQARAILRLKWDEYHSEIVTPFQSSPAPCVPLSMASVEMRESGMSEKANCLLEREIELIRSEIVETRVVQVTLASGVEMNFHVVLDYKPARRQVRIATLRQYVKKHGRGWKLRLELANLLFAAGQWDEAIEEYRQVLDRQPKRLDVSFRLGETLRLMERSEEAVAVYETALSHVRKPTTQFHLRGRIELCRGSHDTAADTFLQAASLEPRNPMHWHALAAAHQLAGRSHEELQAYEEALRIAPDDVVALTGSHDALFPAGRFVEVRERLERVVALDPNFVLALKSLAATRSGVGLIKGEEGKKTERLLRRALRLAPGAADVWESLAYFYTYGGEWEKAVAVLKKYVEDHPNSAEGWFHYAKFLAATGDFTTAADAIMKALALYQHEYFIHHVACLLLPEAGRLDELRRVVEEMLQRFPNRWLAYKVAALSLVKWLNEPERACRLAYRMTELQPNLAEAWLYLGSTLALAGKHHDALPALRRSVELLPEGKNTAHLLVPAALELGESLRATGKRCEACDWFEKAAQCAPDMNAPSVAEASFYLGQAREALGDWDAARRAYETALENHLTYPSRREAEVAVRRCQDGDKPRVHDSEVGKGKGGVVSGYFV